jgi:hydroxymethylpyrimidine pyrophosphatase-like HAD family hydrolase
MAENGNGFDNGYRETVIKVASALQKPTFFDENDGPRPVVGLDVDGTLAPPNWEIPPFNQEFLKGMKEFGFCGILSSGKSAPYLSEQAKACDIEYWFAENNGVWQQNGKEPVVIGENLQSVVDLRKSIGLEPLQEGVQEIHLKDKKGQVLIEESKLGVLTIFPEVGPIAHRADFNETFSRYQVAETLKEIVSKEHLKLKVMEPHGDGAVDIVRLDKYGKPIDKSNFALFCQQLFDGNLNLAFFGDGTNDIPAMIASDVFAVTFQNADQSVKNTVLGKGGYNGYITTLPGPEGGLFQGVIYLAKHDFFSHKSSDAQNYAQDFLNSYLKQQKMFVMNKNPAK